MGWSIGFDPNWKRWVGYGVPAKCDHPDCDADIDRGLSYVCGQDIYGGEHGCGLFFCWEHLHASGTCFRCRNGEEPHEPKPDTIEWIRHMLHDDSWETWRQENPAETEKMRESLRG